MTLKLEYISQGPSGYIVCKNNETSFKLYYEFGGGRCIVTVYLPHDWEKETNTKLEEKQGILDFISKQVILDKAPNSYSEIVEDKWLNIMKS